MTGPEFEKVLQARFEKAKQLLSAKSSEYARGDKLSNFKKAAGLLGKSPEEALMGMLAKHLVSVGDFCQDVTAGRVIPYALWEEKITDVINYMVLLDAIITEKQEVK